MVRVAILCVLVLIVVLIAPWILLVVAAGVALYGTALVVAAAVFVGAGVAVLGWLAAMGIKRRHDDRPEQIHGARVACGTCQAEMPALARHCRNCGT